ncbi:MAG TPA: tetratricopeptide repeat protein, partial [Haloferula sp.]
RKNSSLGLKQLSVTCLAGFIILLKLANIPFFHHQAGLWQDPLQIYLSVAYNRPAQFHQKTLAAQELIERREYQAARTLLDESLSEAPWHTINYMMQGEIAFQAGDYQTAWKDFELGQQMVKTGIRYKEYFGIRRGKILLAAGKFAEARDMLLPVLQRPASEQHYPATLILADIYHQQGDQEKARQTLEKSASLHPEKRSEIERILLQLPSPNSPSAGQ